MAINIADLVEHSIDLNPDRLALVDADRELTFAQLEEKANRLANYLRDHGVGPGDKVGIYSRNTIEAIVSMVAIFKARAIMVNVNYRYVENELQYIFENSDMVALIHERRYSDKVAGVLPNTPLVKTAIVVEDGTDLDYSSYGGVEFEQALSQGSPERNFGERSPDDIFILYTGGTTGMPRASCGGTRTGGVCSAAASTSSPVNTSRTNGNWRSSAPRIRRWFASRFRR
ncbi:AMP-binding protein [Rhodococcus hoagii]|nr:AMP-binding protein [Prescottella equi]